MWNTEGDGNWFRGVAVDTDRLSVFCKVACFVLLLVVFCLLLLLLLFGGGEFFSSFFFLVVGFCLLVVVLGEEVLKT